MTVTSMVPSDTPYLPQKVTEVSKEVLKNFPHSKKVGNYLLGNTLGEGSFAKVKEALHIPTGERVAVKIIDKQKSREDSYVRKNLRREGKILQMIRHTNIIQLLEIMETQNSYYLVTELCRGGDLMDHISQRRKLQEVEVKKYTRQIISAVDYLHRLGILHRDLKIENLLLDEYQNMKIIDFGLSNCIKVVHTKDGTKAQEFCVTQCGSPAYAAPELLGRRKYGPQVDVWSIGVNIYAMLTGNLPFTVEPFNIKALHNKMVNAQMNPVPDGISKDCRDLIKKFLNPDPDRRIKLEEAMKHPWIADGPGNPLSRAPCPNKLKSDSLDNSIIKHMSDQLGFRVGEVIRFVSGNIPSSATSMYHLFARKLAKHYGNLRAMGKIPADHRLLGGRSQQNQGLQVKEKKVNLMKTGQSRTPRPAQTSNPARNTLPTQNKVKATSVTTSTKESNSEKDIDDVDNSDGNEDTFTDLQEMKGKPDTAVGPARAKTPGMVPKREPQHTAAPAFLPSVASKYVVGNLTRRKEGSAGPANPRRTKPDTASKETTIMSDVLETEDGTFRKRASTFPGKTARPAITVNRKLFTQVQKDRAENGQSGNSQQYHINTSAFRGRKNGTGAGEAQGNKATHNQHMYSLLRRQQAGSVTPRRPVINTSAPYSAREDSHRRLSPDNEKFVPQKQHLLARPNANFNKLQRAKLEPTDDGINEHISLISATSRPTSPGNSNNSSNPASPTGLPCLSPTNIMASSRRS